MVLLIKSPQLADCRISNISNHVWANAITIVKNPEGTLLCCVSAKQPPPCVKLVSLSFHKGDDGYVKSDKCFLLLLGKFGYGMTMVWYGVLCVFICSLHKTQTDWKIHNNAFDCDSI